MLQPHLQLVPASLHVAPAVRRSVLGINLRRKELEDALQSFKAWDMVDMVDIVDICGYGMFMDFQLAVVDGYGSPPIQTSG